MKKNFLKASAFFMSVLALTIGMTSCNNGDPDDPNKEGNVDSKDAVELVLEQSSVTVSEGETVIVAITQGNGGYTVKSANEEVAVAEVSGTTVSIKGLKAGSTTITVVDKAPKAKAISVQVSSSTDNNIRTDVLYTITSTADEWSYQGDEWGNTWANYKGPKTYEHTPICTKRDYDSNKMNSTSYKADSSTKDFFALQDDDNVFLCSGLGYEGATEYGHAAIALLLTNEDDPAHPGMKKMEVITTNLGAYLDWAGYTSTPGSAYYNPADGSFTLVNCKGLLAWENGSKPFQFCADRTYTPEK